MVTYQRKSNSTGWVVALTLLAMLAIAGALVWVAQNRKNDANNSGGTDQRKQAEQQKKNDEQQTKKNDDSPPIASLTPEQRAAWERARAKWDKQSHYVYALRGVKKPEWMSVDGKSAFDGVNGWSPQVHCTNSSVGDAFPIDGQGTFIEGRNVSFALSPELACRTVATEPETQIAVVVDLFSNRDPVVRAWFQFQGGTVKELKNVPAAITKSFASHMRVVQQKIGR